MKKTLLFFLAFIALQLLAAAGVQMAFGGTTTTSLLAASALSNVATIIVFVAARWVPKAVLLPPTRHAATVTLWAAILGLAMLLPLQGLEELIPDAFRTDLLSDTFPQLMATAWGFVPIAVLAPVAEEIVFRGAILSAILGYYYDRPLRPANAKGWALVLTAALFAAVHGNPAQMPHAFIVGMLLAYVTLRTRSLLPAIAIHVANNTCAYLLGHFYPQTIDMSVSDLFHGSVLLMSAILLIMCALSCLAVTRIHRLSHSY